jgi:hypothetical protein
VKLTQIVHVLPHRVRLRAAVLVGQRSTCERVARKLAEQVECGQVAVRPLTGSVIVEGPQVPDPAFLSARLAALLSEEYDDSGRRLGEPPPLDANSTKLAEAILTAVKTLNADVRDRLDNEADLGVLASVLLAAVGVVEASLAGKLELPSWSTLFWYSASWMTVVRPRPADSSQTEVPHPT